jgi:hypothetical protein
LTDWHETSNEYRIVSTYKQLILNAGVLVSVTACQLPDGSVNTTYGNVAEPEVFIDKYIDGTSRDLLSVSVQGARDLAAALLEAADELDGWAAR